MNQVGELFEKYQNIVLKGFDPVSAGGFTQIPNILIRTTKLSSTTKLIYAQLLSYAWHNNMCFPGQERLAEDCGTSLATITRSIRELVDGGWLEVQRRGQGKTNMYVLKYVVDKTMKK
jgi:DNA-binding MarR family transcriptional regulator